VNCDVVFNNSAVGRSSSHGLYAIVMGKNSA
jgi:hypothetical protein